MITNDIVVYDIEIIQGEFSSFRKEVTIVEKSQIRFSTPSRFGNLAPRFSFDF